MSANLTVRVISKPSKYSKVVDTFKRLRINQAMEVSNGANPHVVRCGVYSVLKKNYEGNFSSTIQNNAAVFWKE